MDDKIKQQIEVQRSSLLRRLKHRLDRPLAVLGVLWLVLIVIEFTRGLGSFLSQLSIAIWIVFLTDFAITFTVAPDKTRYLRSNWLTLLSLAVPALRAVRFLRVLRLARTLRGLRMLRLLASLNRGMRALGVAMRRRGFGYVMLLTLLVWVSGAAGMVAFESGFASGTPLDRYATSLWWTAMILTTMGSEYWPKTAEGRFLCLVLAVYGFTMFGYVTATLATFFVQSDSKHDASAPAKSSAGASALEPKQ